MSKLETEEEETVKKWCKAHDVLFIKFTPYGEVGWPDRICIFPAPTGTHVWLELKRKGEIPRPIQYHRIQQIRDQGGNVYWTDCAQMAIRILELYL